MLEAGRGAHAELYTAYATRGFAKCARAFNADQQAPSPPRRPLPPLSHLLHFLLAQQVTWQT